MSEVYEVNFDGLVGPTHNYAGLSLGNVASVNNAAAVSNPMEAALQGLEKMKALADLGFKQGVIPPLERPDVFTLRRLGFTGSDEQVIAAAARKAPKVLVACSSASSMWTANACTMAPSTDTEDGLVHITPANLANKFHRSIEWPQTSALLKAIFKGDRFAHHEALPQGDHFGDEGAANHTRLAPGYGDQGLHLFVFGKYAFDASKPAPKHFPARQTREASEAVARLHKLREQHVLFIQQNPAVIDQGVFHNDVICVGNMDVLFYHEEAFLEKEATLTALQAAWPHESPLRLIEVPSSKVSVSDAVNTYLFNSQLLEWQDGRMLLVCPGECRENERVSRYLDELIASGGPIADVRVFDVKQSMRNGGGPACLRQRVVLNQEELAQTNPQCLINDDTHAALTTWVRKHYRDRLQESDLADPSLLRESREALDELTTILGIGSVYPFQLAGA
jgi:succinylarginine dihydrolase